MPSITKVNENLFRKAFENECSKIKAEVLVDIGSGDGRYSRKLSKITQTKKTICIDHDLKMLKKAEKRGCIIIQADLNQKITLKNNTADLIIINQVIEHIAKTDMLVSEVYRILKPGGKAIWCTPNLASWHNIFALALGYQPFSSQISDQAYLGNPYHPMNNKRINEPQAHLRLFTPYSLSSLLKYHQFKINSSYTVGYYPFKKLATFSSKIDQTHGAYITIVATKS